MKIKIKYVKNKFQLIKNKSKLNHYLVNNAKIISKKKKNLLKNWMNPLKNKVNLLNSYNTMNNIKKIFKPNFNYSNHTINKNLKSINLNQESKKTNLNYSNGFSVKENSFIKSCKSYKQWSQKVCLLSINIRKSKI